MPRPEKYPPDEIERLVKIGNTAEQIAEQFAGSKDGKDYKNALRRVKAVIKRDKLDAVKLAQDAMTPEIQADLSEWRDEVRLKFRGHASWALEKLEVARIRLEREAQDDEGYLPLPKLNEFMSSVQQCAGMLARAGVSLEPPPPAPVSVNFNLTQNNEFSIDADPDGLSESKRLEELHSRLKALPAAGNIMDAEY